MAENRAEWGNYCVRQLPWESVDVRDVRGRRMESGDLLIIKAESRRKSLSGRNWGVMGELLIPSGPVSFRPIPRTPVDVRDVFGRKMEDSGLLWEIHQKPKRKKLGANGEISDSVSFRGHPRCVWAEDGTCEIITPKPEKCPKWHKPGRNGQIIVSVRFRQLPRTYVDVRDVCGRKMEAGGLLGKERTSP